MRKINFEINLLNRYLYIPNISSDFPNLSWKAIQIILRWWIEINDIFSGERIQLLIIYNTSNISFSLSFLLIIANRDDKTKTHLTKANYFYVLRILGSERKENNATEKKIIFTFLASIEKWMDSLFVCIVSKLIIN